MTLPPPHRQQRLARRIAVLLYCCTLVAAVVWFEWRMFRALRQQHNDNDNTPPSAHRLGTASFEPSTTFHEQHLGKPNAKAKPGWEPHGSKGSGNNSNGERKKPVLKETSVDVKKPPPRNYTDGEYSRCQVLRRGDIVYTYGPWDGSPIVVESHKLVFFTVPKVGCTVWKQLFRRMEGYLDWAKDRHPLPHAPPRNGLAYLYDYPPATADQMLTDPSWTRAIFVRDPKERLLSAYLDKGRQNQYVQFHCCKYTQPHEELRAKLQCDRKQAHYGPADSQADETPPLLSFSDFVSLLVPRCPDPHWNPQSHRIDAKYWPHINFVGHMETVEQDSERLLKRVGAWEEYGKQGWPPEGRIFAGTDTVSHVTDSSSQLERYFTFPVERTVDQLLLEDYNNSVMGFQRRQVSTSRTE